MVMEALGGAWFQKIGRLARPSVVGSFPTCSDLSDLGAGIRIYLERWLLHSVFVVVAVNSDRQEYLPSGRARTEAGIVCDVASVGLPWREVVVIHVSRETEHALSTRQAAASEAEHVSRETLGDQGRDRTGLGRGP